MVIDGEYGITSARFFFLFFSGSEIECRKIPKLQLKARCKKIYMRGKNPYPIEFGNKPGISAALSLLKVNRIDET